MPIAVVYDQGSASADEIIKSLRGYDELVVILPDSFHAQSVRPFFANLDVVDMAESITETIDRLRRISLRGVVTFSERMMSTTAAIADGLNLPGHSPVVARRLSNKAIQRECLRTEGVDAVACLRITSLEGWAKATKTLDLPVVVKPVYGEGSRNTVLISSPAEGDRILPALLAAERELVVEEFLEGIVTQGLYGDYVSVETAVSAGVRSHYAITGKFKLAPPFRENGQFWPASMSENVRAQVTELADRAVAAVDVTYGLVHTEIKLTPKGPRIIELNGRIGGMQTELAQRSVGLDLIRVAADIACGKPIAVSAVQPAGVVFQHYTPGPTSAGTVAGVTGVAEVRAMPEVSRCRQLVRPGTAVGGTHTHLLDVVSGAVDHHEQMMSAVKRIRDKLIYTFEIDGTKVQRSASHLAAYP